MTAPRILRQPDRATEFLAAGRVAHLTLLDRSQAIAIPFRYHFDSAQPDRLYLCGSTASLTLRLAASGALVSVTVSVRDGTVCARSAINRSIPYRSLVCFGHGRLVAERLRPAIYHGMMARYYQAPAVGRNRAATDVSSLLVEIGIEEWLPTPA